MCLISLLFLIIAPWEPSQRTFILVRWTDHDRYPLRFGVERNKNKDS